MKRTTAHRGALAALASCLLVIALAPSTTAAPAATSDDASRTPMRKIVKSKRIAPGLVFTRIIEKKLPRRTFVLEMDPRKAVTLDVALADAALPGTETIRAIANRHDALAATNGDFGDPRIGRPTHPMLIDDVLVQTSAQRGPLFAVSRDERSVFVGKPELVITATEVDPNLTWTIDRWNRGPAAPGEIVAFSPVGGTLEPPADQQCSVRLTPAEPPSSANDGVSQRFTVAETGCPSAGMDRQGGVVISAAPATDEATHLLALAPGSTVVLRWSFGWDASDVVGGMPVLVEGGRTVAPSCSTVFCRRNPRTAIGWTGRGHVLLVVVDGRRRRWSVGASLNEMAQIMRDLGARVALNLDGGGSSTMIVKGELVNRPSDDRERHLTNAVLILPGEDPGEA